jgi:hypothetical protein
MAYFGKISPEYATSLEIAERNFTYELLVDQLKEEKKQADDESKKMKASSNRIKSRIPKPRR